ncbi:MAG: glycosyltransferase family 2 protein [Muribaculaceae bacterium]|nr:glycosyltransferase family 2 protein [Muribaculaceae bacterium]
MTEEKYPFYTLIIPHYNIPHLLKRLLLTVPKRDDLQVIVVDDCSTEKLDELELLKKEYNWVEWYTTGINGGGGKARNIGLEHAKGQYLFFADADDFFLPNINDILNSYKYQNNYDIVYFNAISLFSTTLKNSNRGRDWQKLNKILGSDQRINQYLKYEFGEPWCKLVKRELLLKNQIFFDEIPIHNDTLFSYMIGFYSEKIKIDNHAFYCITERETSVSKNLNIENLKIRVEVFSKKNRFLKDNNIKIFDKILLDAFLEAFKKNIALGPLYEITGKYGFNKSLINIRLSFYILKLLYNKFFKFNTFSILRL